MKAGGENAVLNRSEGDVHDGVEEVRAACPALERLGHDVLVIGQVGTAITACVYSCSRQKRAMHAPHLQRVADFTAQPRCSKVDQIGKKQQQG